MHARRRFCLVDSFDRFLVDAPSTSPDLFRPLCFDGRRDVLIFETRAKAEEMRALYPWARVRVWRYQ